MVEYKPIERVLSQQEESSAEFPTAQDWSEQDVTLRPPAYFGTLGPNSDLAGEVSGPYGPKGRTGKSLTAVSIVGMAVGLLIAMAAKSRAPWDRFAQSATARTSVGSGAGPLNRLQPQRQAEKLLELAIGNSVGANEEIAKRVDAWRGRLKLDPQLGTLTAAALNANDLRVRQSGLEVQLAAYGLAKNAATVDLLLQRVDSSNHAQKIWALWALGALANRGVETARVQQALVAHLGDGDEDSRLWAVEGLSLIGNTATIPPLLGTMHNDPSPAVRERAACSLAESGMLSHEQRLTAVPQLVNYTADTSLDSQTHAWAYQALGDITKQRLPNDSAAWRNWYASAQTE